MKHLFKKTTLALAMILLNLGTANAAEVDWNSNVPPTVSDGDNVIVSATASGTLTIPDGVTTLTIQGDNTCTSTVVTGGQIEVTNTGSLELTLIDLDINAPAHKSAINATTSSS